MQSSRYFSSLEAAASAALLHKSLCSMHPASLQRDEMKWQHAWASFTLNAALFVRTSRQSSLASTHVLMYLKWCSACSRSFWRLSSMAKFSFKCLENSSVFCFVLLYFENFK